MAVLHSITNENNDIIRFLIARGAAVNVRDTWNKKTALGHIFRQQEIYRSDVSISRIVVETIKILKDVGATE